MPTPKLPRKTLEAIAREAAFLLAAYRGTQHADPATAQWHQRELKDSMDEAEHLLAPTGLMRDYLHAGGYLVIE